MAERVELYKRINSLAVPGFTYDQIQGVPAIPAGIPFRDGHVPDFSLVAVNGDMPEGTELLNDRLVQVTPAHGRSYEFRFGGKGSLYFADKYGNVFSSLTTKGNNLETPKIERDGNAPSGYRIYGMQDSDSMLRVLHASELLRSHNIDTEIILRVIEPQQLPLEGQLVPLQDFKGGLIQKFWDENRSERANLPTITKALNDMTLFITVRGHQVPERMQDLLEARTRDEFKSVMSRVFEYVNKVSKASFDVENDEDIRKYFEEYLPKNIAINYARLHNLGLIHFYPHQGNISTVGSIYDLDSIKGQDLGLGDEENTKQGFKNEMERVCDETKQTITGLQREGFIDQSIEIGRHFEDRFYQTYFDERSKPNILSVFSELYDHNDEFGIISQAARYEVYTQKVIEALGWDYAHAETLEQLIDSFYAHDARLIDSEVQKALKNPRSKFIPEEIIEEGLIKSDEYNSHSAGDRFTLFVTGRIRDAITIEKEEELAQVGARYGTETVDDLVRMFANREYERLSSQISNTEEEEMERQEQEREERIKRKYLDDSKGFYIRLLKENPEDYDSLALVDVMYQLYETFGEETPEVMEALELYLERVGEKLGFNYTHPETFDQLKQAYFLDVELGARVVFEKELVKREDYKDFDDMMEVVLGAAYDSPFSSLGFGTYIHDRVERTIENAYKSLLAEPKDKYGDHIVHTILMWIGYKEQHRIYPDSGEGEQMKDIDETSKVLDESLREEFIQRF